MLLDGYLKLPRCLGQYKLNIAAVIHGFGAFKLIKNRCACTDAYAAVWVTFIHPSIVIKQSAWVYDWYIWNIDCEMKGTPSFYEMINKYEKS